MICFVNSQIVIRFGINIITTHHFVPFNLNRLDSIIVIMRTSEVGVKLTPLPVH
jgi:hypothetical protein